MHSRQLIHRYQSYKSHFDHVSTLIEMCHGQAARRQRRELLCVRHHGIEISSGFQTKPWLVAMTACSTRYRPPADFFGYEVVEASQSWMTVSQHQGARGSHAAPPPLVATLRALLTENADENLENPSTTVGAQSPWLEGHQRVRARPSECASVKWSAKNRFT